VSDPDGSEPVAVKTRVPRRQKAEWRDHADRLEMSQSEFVRTMVQAGRRGFEGVDRPDPVEPGDPDSNPRGIDLEDRILDALEASGPMEWEALVEAVTEDLEERLAEAAEALGERGAVEQDLRGRLEAGDE